MYNFISSYVAICGLILIVIVCMRKYIAIHSIAMHYYIVYMLVPAFQFVLLAPMVLKGKLKLTTKLTDYGNHCVMMDGI